MKEILVAFDFSKNALHTLEYALMYANQVGTGIHLVWVDNTSTPDQMMNIEQTLRIETKKYFDDIVAKYQPKLKQGKIQIHLRKGKVYSEIEMIAKQINADIIFAGTHGVSGYERFWIGSNAYRIVTSAPCPVITLRADYTFRNDIKRILVPIDSSAESRQKLPFTAALAEAFQAEIHLILLYNSSLSVIRNRMKSSADEALKCLKEKNIQTFIKEVETEKIAQRILDYSTELDADLISIMTEQSNTAGNMFLGPYAQQLVNNSLIPVLSIQTIPG
ncbi:MAG: universal stress protein [Bacteroidetes bacterium]|jgi:nucleotide-binding universal stress UspA family protein|nr:universal stress protein [Bacteroidota bacterium]